jgi:hypothetical protein
VGRRGWSSFPPSARAILKSATRVLPSLVSSRFSGAAPGHPGGCPAACLPGLGPRLPGPEGQAIAEGERGVAIEPISRDAFSGPTSSTSSSYLPAGGRAREGARPAGAPTQDPVLPVAASRGGPRYDASLTPEDRANATNAIWLCQNCAKLIEALAAKDCGQLRSEYLDRHVSVVPEIVGQPWPSPRDRARARSRSGPARRRPTRKASRGSRQSCGLERDFKSAVVGPS